MFMPPQHGMPRLAAQVLELLAAFERYVSFCWQLPVAVVQVCRPVRPGIASGRFCACATWSMVSV